MSVQTEADVGNQVPSVDGQPVYILFREDHRHARRNLRIYPSDGPPVLIGSTQLARVLSQLASEGHTVVAQTPDLLQALRWGVRNHEDRHNELHRFR